MNRRTFMSATGVMLGTGVIASVASFPLISASPSATEPALSNWDDVRSQFNLSPNKINMSCYWHASHPKPVREAIEQHRRGLDECPSEYFEENAPRLEAAVRTAAADYLAAKPDDFAMTGSTTQGLGTIYGGLKLRPGQEILSTEQDHIMSKLSLRLRAERMGMHRTRARPHHAVRHSKKIPVAIFLNMALSYGCVCGVILFWKSLAC